MPAREVRCFSLILVGCLATLNGIAQTNEAQTRLESTPIAGYSGQISVLPNADRGETTVVLSNIPTTDSHQIVFHLQGTANSVPVAWNGSGRVLTGYGVLAVVSDDLPHGLLFLFPGLQTPASMKQMSFDQYPIYGIARFGEKSPLTSEAIDRLVSTGKTSVDIDFNPDKLNITPAKAGNPSCASGGPGSEECSQNSGGSGCSVVCNLNYYACCNAGSCTCVQEPQ
jgi:hypothetical protein